MRSLTRDILISLMIKLMLLTALWYTCFKKTGESAESINVSQRLLGVATSALQRTR